MWQGVTEETVRRTDPLSRQKRRNKTMNFITKLIRGHEPQEGLQTTMNWQTDHRPSCDSRLGRKGPGMFYCIILTSSLRDRGQTLSGGEMYTNPKHYGCPSRPIFSYRCLQNRKAPAESGATNVNHLS